MGTDNGLNLNTEARNKILERRTISVIEFRTIRHGFLRLKKRSFYLTLKLLDETSLEVTSVFPQGSVCVS